MVKMTQHITTLFDQINTLTSTINTLEYLVNKNRDRGDRGGKEEAEVVVEKTVARGKAENNVGHIETMNTKG